jgi:RimJ/RimL family protein N-acetyltransferase
VIEVRESPAAHYGWIAERAQLVVGPQFRAIEAIDGDRILAMVGYDGWTPGAVMLHVALEHAAALRHVIRRGFEVAFRHRPVVVASVLSTNRASLELVRHLGFREAGRGLDWWAPGVDLVWFDMRRHECRWLGAERKAA